MDKKTVGNSYRLSVILSALAAGILFLIYLSCIAVLPYLLFKWVTFVVNWTAQVSLPPRDGTPVEWKLIIGFVLLAVGVSAVLILLCYSFLKPWFRKSRPPEFVLPESGCEELMDFVREVATHVGAPVPKRILLTAEMNAGASVDGGLRALLRRELVLTIGLPLVRSMTVTEFGGVLAHEFGHFKQRSGMLAMWLVRSVGGWFEQAVQDQLRWDQRMEFHGTNSQHEISGFVFYVAKLLFWCSSLVARIFVFLSRLTSSMTMRKMEFDADQAAISFVGVQGFRSMIQRLVEGNAAEALSFKFQEENLRHTGTICSDVVVLHNLILRRQSEDQRSQLWETALKIGTKMMDTHPSIASRMAAAERSQTAPICVNTNDAWSLFGAWSDLTKAVTQATFVATFSIYKLPPTVSPEFVLGLPEVPTVEAVKRLKLHGISLPERHWHLAWSASSECTEGNESCHDDEVLAYQDLCDRRSKLIAAQALAVVGKTNAVAVGEELRQVDESIERSAGLILPVLSKALQSISSQPRFRHEQIPAEWLQILNAVAEVWPNVLLLEEQQITMQVLLDDAGQKAPVPACYKKLTTLHKEMQSMCGSILKQLGGLPVPDGSHGRGMKVQDYVQFPCTPPIAPWPTMSVKSRQMVGRLLGLPLQALSALVLAMECKPADGSEGS